MDSSTSSSPPASPSLTRQTCLAMLSQVTHDCPLPDECSAFPDVKLALQRKNSNRHNQAIAFQGMNPGEAAAAMKARDHGHLHHAQIQRRLTSEKSRRLW